MGIWKDAEVFQSDSLLKLSQQLTTVIGAGLTNSTTNKYSSAWKGWVEWCKQNPEINVLPASPFSVALYLTFLLETKNKTGPIISAFYGIRWGHVIAGIPSPTSIPFVQLAFEGCQRLCQNEKKGPKDPKDPISTDLLKLFFEKLIGTNNLKDLRFLNLCFLGFAGFFRIEELLLTQIKNVKILDTHVEIFLEKSKCDQHRDGEIVYISKIDSKYCPVNLLLYFLNACNIDIDKDLEFFLIPRLFATKKGHKVSKNSGISYTRARGIFVKKL